MNNRSLSEVAADYATINNWWTGPVKEQNKVSKLMEETFKAGADWQKEQYKETITLLKGIAEWAGNLPDNKLTTKTGANDAAHRGGLITDMRSIAVEAIRKVEPDYVPFPGYTHSS